LVFLDLETTGLEIATARVVEISFLKILPDGKEKSLTSLINPKFHSPRSDTYSWYKDSDVAEKPTFKEIAQELIDLLKLAI